MAYTKTNWENGVTPINADNMNKIESGIENALAKPDAVLSSNELVGVGVNGEQVRVQLGEGLTLEGSTSPYTLKASGGTQWYRHTITVNMSDIIEFVNNTSTPYTSKDTLLIQLSSKGAVGILLNGFGYYPLFVIYSPNPISPSQQVEKIFYLNDSKQFIDYSINSEIIDTVTAL